ncbi:MAG: zinc ABC transporter substrate-binding protein [Desulfobacterales bacterium]
MYSKIRLLFTAIILIVFSGTGFTEDKISVFVSIAPQKYFVQQIGKELVDVQVMIHPGADPHTYEPKPRQMVAIAKAQLYFAVGIEFEEVNLKKITATSPNLKIIHTDQGIKKIAMAAHHYDDPAEEHHEGDHDHKDHREHTELDPHIWLSPPLVRQQARTILVALQEADPAHRSVYETNFQKFAASIDHLDAELKTMFAGKTGLRFMVFHPSWGYFAYAYGLKQVPIEIEGKNPKPLELKELIDHARNEGIKVIFAQPQFSDKSARLVAKEIGGQVVYADPLAEDWMSNLMAVADKFKAALK